MEERASVDDLLQIQRSEAPEKRGRHIEKLHPKGGAHAFYAGDGHAVQSVLLRLQRRRIGFPTSRITHIFL